MRTDIRTNLYFPRDQYAAVKQIAKQLGISVSEYVRQVIGKDIKVREGQIDWEHDPVWNIIGIGRTKERDVSINHDYYLYGAPKKKVKK